MPPLNSRNRTVVLGTVFYQIPAYLMMERFLRRPKSKRAKMEQAGWGHFE